MSHPLPELARQHAAHKAVRARLMAGKHHDEGIAERRRLKLDRLMERLRPVVLVNGVVPSASIIAAVAHVHQLKIADIKGCRRWNPHVEARAHAAYLLHTMRPDLSTPTIGRLLGGKWHTTVLYSVNVIWPRVAARWKGKVSFD